MPPNTYHAQRPEDLQKLSADNEGLTVITQLEESVITSSASNWGFDHLLAYRLLKQPETSFLKPFKNDHKNACPICNRNKPSTQTINGDMLNHLLRDVEPSELLQTESKLLRDPAGHLLVAIAQASQASQANVNDDRRTQPDRNRQPVERPDHVDSSAAVFGSSSPTRRSSSPTRPEPSEYSVKIEEIDEDDNERFQDIPENIAVSLAIAILRYVLQYILIQPDGQVEIRARLERLRVQARIVGFDGITFEDDAGVAVYLKQEYGWKMANPFMAMVEGKRAFKYIHKDHAGRSHPIVSDKVTAQYLAQAVIAWKARPDLLNEGVFLIAVSNTFIKFIYFTFGEDYREYLDATTFEKQMELVKDPQKDTFAYMDATKWYDTRMSEARRLTACTILTRLRQNLPGWHFARDAISPLSNTNMESDSDDSMRSEYNDHDFDNEKDEDDDDNDNSSDSDF